MPFFLLHAIMKVNGGSSVWKETKLVLFMIE